MALSSDPYEQRLYQMFQAHDVDSCGRLDRNALVKLCHTLELKERGHLLVRCLLGGEEGVGKRQQNQSQKHQQQQQRVTFKEFREGLLHILGGEEQQQQGADSSDGHQIVSTGSPTSSGGSLPTSITSHTSTKHLHLPSSHHNSSSYQQQHHARKSAAADSKKLEPVTESVVVVSSSSSSNISSTVPSGEDDLGATTTTPVTTTPSNLIINTATTDNDNEESSDREVSPKFVVGTKKYGRRSRPRQDCNGFDTSSDFSNSDNESVPLPGVQPEQQQPNAEDATAAAGKSSSKVQRSASQSDIHGSKRRRPMGGSRLKRCASLPTHRQRPADLKLTQARIARDQLNMEHDKIDKKIYFMKLSENLREIWDSLVGNGHGDLLNQSQLEIVCERVGLQKLPARLAAQEVFIKLSLQPIEGISFDEFISLLQSNSDILPITPCNAPSNPPTFNEEPAAVTHEELDRDSVEETVGFTLLPPMPDWTAEIGSLAASIIVDMWESAGVVEPRQLLHELGFYGEELQVADLVAALDDEQQRLGDGSAQQEVIMRASLALHKAEVAALRQAFVQLVEENKKLYSDNKEVNHRATLLAQEVDERHNSLENSTRAKIRLLEQRHHETVKELTSQLAFEREQLSCANAVLEKRIQALEAEDGKAKAEIGRLVEENDGLRSEQENLVKELTDLLEKNIKLNKDIAELEENNRNDLDDGFDRKDDLEVLELIEKISILQDENTQLRDKNDEFTAEIESLNLELAKFKLKRSGISRTSSLEASPGVVAATAGDSGIGEESSSAARKRQGDSPSKARLSDESPRLGKFRKCSNDLENESDSSGDWMALQSELGIRVDSGITSSGISQDYSIVSESGGKEEEIRLLKAKVVELEKKLEDKKISGDGSSASTEGEKSEDTDSSKKLDPEKIKARCDELEASMEQLSKEYEACEDYWQSKLNEERQLYEEEQRIADDKFNELLKKMAEYEEQFAGQASSKSEDGRLSPIEEKDVLEQQYLDLEAEFQQAQQMLEEKSHEVEKFRCRILELEQLAKYPSEAMLATPPRIETPEMDSPASSPISYLWNQSTIQAPATRDYQNPNWCQPLKVTTTTSAAQNADDGSKSPLPAAAKTMDQLTVEDPEPGFSRTISPIQKPPSSTVGGNSTTDVTSCGGGQQEEVGGDCSDVCSVKSARSTHSLASTHSIHKSVSQTDVAMVSQEQLKHQRLMQLQLQDEIKELTHQRDCLKMEFQQMTEVKPFLARSYNKTAHPNLTQKIQHLENKNRHLNGMLKQQQAYSEQILHRIWQHQRSEIAEMSNRLEAQSIVIADQAKRLASNDILVKDLYVENTHLAAQVQRLEQQKVRATLLQQYTQAAAASGTGHPHPHQLSGIVPGMP